MAKCKLHYNLVGTVAATEYEPLLGSGERNVFLEVGGSVTTGITNVSSGVASPLNITTGVGNYPDLIVVVSTVAGVLAWRDESIDANNVAICVMANFPVIISNPHIPDYDAAATSTDEEATDDNVAPILDFYHTSLGTTAVVTVFAIGDGDDT